MQKIDVKTIKGKEEIESLVGMKDIKKDFSREIDQNAFKRFVEYYGANTIGYNNRSVYEEAFETLKLCRDAVTRYGLLRNQYNSDKNVVGHIPTKFYEKEATRVSKLFERAEMKILWLNRICRELTGCFFFKGKLEKEGDRFTLGSIYSLVDTVASEIFN